MKALLLSIVALAGLGVTAPAEARDHHHHDRDHHHHVYVYRRAPRVIYERSYYPGYYYGAPVYASPGCGYYAHRHYYYRPGGLSFIVRF